MRTLKAEALTPVVRRLCIDASCQLPQDVQRRIEAMRLVETWPVARDTLDKIVQNYQLAGRGRVPICQDTGVACVFLDIGREVYLEGDVEAAVNAGVRQGYADGYLRKSVVGDPLRRANTGDNTPAMIYYQPTDGDRVTVTVAPKGFGSENMSHIAMLKPSDGEAGVLRFVLDTVEAAGPNPCPPIVVGVGLGGTFDKAALLAKRALLRPLGQPHPDSYYAGLERQLLAEINALGIGPQGYGGHATALSVAIETLPTHIAGLPCAVNLNCHAARHVSEVL